MSRLSRLSDSCLEDMAHHREVKLYYDTIAEYEQVIDELKLKIEELESKIKVCDE